MAPEGTAQYRAALALLLRSDIGRTFVDEPLSRHCSWRIGGPADLLVEPETARQAALVVQRAVAEGIPLVVIGAGSNLLFSDQGVRGVVLKIAGRMSRCAVEGNRIVAEAGLWMPRLARKAAQAGISGFEHTVGIPGTLGGLVLMNGGSQRKNIGCNVLRIWGVNRNGEELIVERDACAFSYRHCALPFDNMLITRVELAGGSGDRQAIRQEMLGILRERRRKFPLKEPNCGSVFLSTPELHAAFGPPGKIIEEAGLKGFQLGDAEVSTKHGNFIVNRGAARACEVLALIKSIRESVSQRYGVDLCCEVRYVTPEGETVSADRACELQERWSAP